MAYERLKNRINETFFVGGLLIITGVVLWGGVRERKETMDLSSRLRDNSFKHAGIALSQVDKYEEIFDTNDDGLNDYVVRLRNGEVMIIHSYNYER